MADIIINSSSNRSNAHTVGSAASPRLMSCPPAVCPPLEESASVADSILSTSAGRRPSACSHTRRMGGMTRLLLRLHLLLPGQSTIHLRRSEYFSVVRLSAARLSGEAADSGHCWLWERLSTRTRRQSMRTRGGEGPARLRSLHAHWCQAC